MPASITDSSVISFTTRSPWSASDLPDTPERPPVFLRTGNGNKRQRIEAAVTPSPLRALPAGLAAQVRQRGPMHDDSPPLKRFKAGTLATPRIVQEAFHEDFQLLRQAHPDLDAPNLHRKLLGRYPGTDLDTVRDLCDRYAAAWASRPPVEVSQEYGAPVGLSPAERQARRQDIQAWLADTRLRLDVVTPASVPTVQAGAPCRRTPGEPASPDPSIDPPSIVSISDASAPPGAGRFFGTGDAIVFFPPSVGLPGTPPGGSGAGDPPPAAPTSMESHPSALPDADFDALLETFRNDVFAEGMPDRNALDEYIRGPGGLSPWDWLSERTP